MSSYSRFGGSSTPQGAAAHMHPIAVFWFAVWLIAAIVWLIGWPMRAEHTQNEALMLPGVLGSSSG